MPCSEASASRRVQTILSTASRRKRRRRAWPRLKNPQGILSAVPKLAISPQHPPLWQKGQRKTIILVEKLQEMEIMSDVRQRCRGGGGKLRLRGRLLDVAGADRVPECPQGDPNPAARQRQPEYPHQVSRLGTPVNVVVVVRGCTPWTSRRGLGAALLGLLLRLVLLDNADRAEHGDTPDRRPGRSRSGAERRELADSATARPVAFGLFQASTPFYRPSPVARSIHTPAFRPVRGCATDRKRV